MSEIRANTVSDAAGTGPVTLTKQSAAKAWVNFNGTGTVAVRDSFNVASLTDGGTGAYTVGFTNNFSSADHAPVFGGRRTTANTGFSITTETILASSVLVYTWSNTTNVDWDYMLLSGQGDLA